MRSLVTFLIALAGLAAAPAQAQAQAQVLSVETYVEEWDAASQQWVRIEGGANRLAANPMAANPMVAPTLSREPAEDPALATYGPFRVIDQNHAEMVGVTNKASPRQFAAMLRDHPSIETLTLVEAPGTDDDRANLRVARMIRSAGITTHVPNGGSVRSGAVELFLAGAERRIDDGAEFAVHSWIDAHGRQPQDFAMDAAPNRMYLDFYREMGMSASEARAFYGMTNSVSYQDAKWLTAQDMRGWIGQENAPAKAEMVTVTAPEKESTPTIAYLDLNTLLP